MTWVALALVALASCAVAEVQGPDCALEWDLVTDSRVVGYRFYVNGDPTKTVPQGTTQVLCADINVEEGYNEVYATAYSERLESDPSNTVTFEYDGSVFGPPTIRLQ